MASGDASDEQVSFLVRHLRQEGRESGAHSLRSEALCILENMSDSQFGSLLNGLAVKPEIVSFIAAILYGCDMSTHPEQVSNRRVKCFEVSVCVLKGGCLNQQGARDLVELLGMHARQLHCEQTLSLIDAALDGSHIGGAGSLTQMLDLLPGLVGGSSDCREYCVEKLYEMAWPCDLVIAYTAALVGLCTSDVECERAMTKIMSYLVHLPGNGKGMEPATAPIHNIDPEELPVLVYHLTSISKKCASSPSLLASLVEVVAESLDAMLTAAQGNEKEHGRRMRPVLATIIHHLATMLTKDQGVADELLNLVKTRCMFTNHSLCYQRTGAPLLSSAKLLLALLASKTPRNEIKTLTALTEFVQEIYALQLIGSTSIWFQPTIWSKVISIYPSHLCDVFDVLLSKCSSMQLEAVSAPLVNLAFLLVSTQASFSPNDFGALGAVAGIIGSEGTIKSGARDVLLQNSIQVAPPHSSSSNTVCNQVPGSPGAFGAWLLSNIFIYNEHARTQIARELVVRLLVHAQVSLLPLSSKPISVKKSLNPRGQVEVSNMHPPSAVTSNPTGHSKVDQEIALLCVSILEKLAVLCPEGLIAVGVDLQESFMALPELAGPTASRLVTVLGGLFGVCHGLSDRCTLALRKSGFARDTIHRKAAIFSLLALFRLHVHSASLTDIEQGASSRFFPRSSTSCSSSYSQRGLVDDIQPSISENEFVSIVSSQQTSEQLMTHSVASLGVGAFVGISVDEILSMCRRFFGYQRDIRVILYDLLVQIQIDFPACRGLVLRLLGNHMNNLISDEKFDLSWATSSSRAKKSSGSSLHPVISETEYVVLHPDKYVDMSSGSPQESLSDALISALMLVCPFRSGPKEMLLTTSQCRADNRRPASASQWDTVDVNFVKSQVAESLVFRCPSEIFLMYDANSFCSRRVCDDTESVQIRNNILKICKGITDNALTELRIPPRIPDSGATILDQHRIFSLLESFHVAMSCTIILPNVSFADCHGIDLTKEKSLKYLCAAASRPRLKLLNYLCTRADVVSALAVSIRKSSKNTGVWPSDPGTPHMSSPLMRFIERFNISSLGSMSAIFQDNTNHVRCPLDTHSGLHIFITEFQFLSEVLTMLNADDDDNDPTIESPVMQAETLIDCNIGAKPYEPPGIAVARVSDVLTKENLHFLENHVLERGVVAYECTLTLLTALMKCERFGDMNCFSTSTRNPTRSNGEQNSDNSGILWAWWGWFAMRAINIKMFSQLLTFFRRQRIRDRSVSAGRRGGVTGEPHCVFTNRQYSNLQLALRAMIGSIRLETAISHLISGHLSKSENIAGIFCARDVIPSSSGLVLLLESGFEGVMRRDAGTTYGSMLTQRFGLDGTQGFASTAYTQEGEAGADTQWIQVLQTHVKNFGKLFLAMHAMEAEKNECPGVVCVISELFDILSMVPAAQKDSADNFLRYCKEKLSQPNGNLCRNLIQFTILHAAADPADRLKRALQCSIMIKSAIKYSEDEQEEAEPDSDAEDDPLFASSSKSSSETCVLVSCSGAYQAASCVIQIMEKACNEIELLYKLARKANARYDKKSNVVYTWTQTNNNTVMNNPQELNTIICATLLRVVHVLEKLLQFELASISPKVLGVVVKVYKFLIKLSKEIATRVNKGVESASTCVIPMYRSLCSRVIDQFATRLSDYLMHVRNAEYSGAGDISNESEDEDNGRKQRKGKSAKIATVNQRLKKLVPDVIYQMEQLDVVFIRLSGALRGAEKVIVSKWIRRTAVCDFKLKADMIQKEQRRNESIELRNERSRNDKKRKQAHSEGSKNNKRQKRMDDDSIIGDESTELGLPYEGIAEEEYDDSMY